ncbi:hypothetical protein ACWGHA_38810, partial [Streptomyces xanthophaeus]
GPGDGAGLPGPGAGMLPRRVRQASLAPQLKNSADHAPTAAEAAPAPDRDAEEVRSRMAALQRGWTAGRKQHAQQQSESGSEAGTPAASGPGYENEGDGR